MTSPIARDAAKACSYHCSRDFAEWPADDFEELLAPFFASHLAQAIKESGAIEALADIPPANIAGDASFAFHCKGGDWCSWMDKRNAALLRLRALSGDIRAAMNQSNGNNTR